jgi:hypothetical protein
MTVNLISLLQAKTVILSFGAKTWGGLMFVNTK